MEEVELIKVAFQGTEMFLRLSGATIKDALKFLKFLVTVIPNYNRWAVNRDNERMRKEMTKAEYDLIKARQKIHIGGMKYEEFIRLYGAEERTIINISDTSADRFYDMAKQHKLTYTLMPDLNLTDGVFQIMVPAAQADIYKVIIDKIAEEELKFNESKISELELEIESLKKEKVQYEGIIENLSQEGKKDSEEYKQAEKNLQDCENKIKEKEKEIAGIKNRNTGEITYEDYMQTNSFAFNHQELFNEMMNQGVELHAFGLSDSIFSVLKGSETVKTEKTDEALTSITAMKDILDTDKKIVLCDLSNPENHIEASTATKEYDDRTYICTTYEVYANGEKQRCEEFSHGEFTHYSDIQGKNSGNDGEQHWENMKKEMKDKGKLHDEVMLFSSVSKYEAFLKEREGENSIYLANPNISEITLRFDKQPDNSYKCTVLSENKETSITYSVKQNMTVSDLAPFIKSVNKMIKRYSDVAEDEWVILNSKNEYEQYLSVLDKNSPSSSEAEKEINAKLPEVKELLAKESQAETQRTKRIIAIPRDNVLILPEMEGVQFDCTIYSNNRGYHAELPYNKVKAGVDDSLLLILEEGEEVVIKERKTGLEAGRITDNSSLNAFLNEDISFLKKMEQNREKIPDRAIQGGKVHAATLQG
ncbi:MAG: hypothetical protein IJA36_06115 [Lachnospiraceae bacterium]|nr:hypothetical protein [Lachnospiraceae bacterium]